MKTVTVILEPEVKYQFKKQCLNDRLSMTRVLQNLIEDYLKENKEDE